MDYNFNVSENFYLADIYVWNVKDFGIYERFSAGSNCVARYLNAGAPGLARSAAYKCASALAPVLNLYSCKFDGRRCMENHADKMQLAEIIYNNGMNRRAFV